MRIVRRDFYDVSRSDYFDLYPIGDCHVGAAACDEDYLRRLVDCIAADDRAWWVGIGDYADFINRSDPRFSFDSLAPWISARMMTDLAGAQRERFLSIVKPIAGKCLAMAEGNHEGSILKYYERDIYSEIVTGVREAAGHPDTYKLALGYTGWLRLAFHRSDITNGRRITTFDIKVHHGYGGGRTPGPKTNRLQDMLLDNDADVVLFGHVHGVTLHSVWVEYLDKGNNVQQRQRVGVITGTCLRSGNPAPDSGATYSERAGYRPQGAWGQVVRLKPGEDDPRRRIRVSTLDV